MSDTRSCVILFIGDVGRGCRTGAEKWFPRDKMNSYKIQRVRERLPSPTHIRETEGECKEVGSRSPLKQQKRMAK